MCCSVGVNCLGASHCVRYGIVSQFFGAHFAASGYELLEDAKAFNLFFEKIAYVGMMLAWVKSQVGVGA